MAEVQLSIIPSYFCNFNCKYCYLGDLRKDKQILSLDILKEMLYELIKKYNIKCINLYGGEISLLSEEYLNNLYEIIKDYKVSLTTNLSNEWILEWAEKRKIRVSVSLNEERYDYDKTLEKLKNIKNKSNITISSVVLPSLLNKEPEDVMDFYEKLGYNVYFIQYHPSEYSKLYLIEQKKYNIFLEKMLKINSSIEIENEKVFLDKGQNPTMKGFIFLTPYGQWQTVYYKDGVEYYKNFDKIEDWEKFCRQEYDEYFKNCCLCEYFGHCKAEHLINYKKPYCSGLFNILKNK